MKTPNRLSTIFNGAYILGQFLSYVQRYTVCDVMFENKNIHSLHYIENESNLKLHTMRNFQSICKPLHCHDKTLILLLLLYLKKSRTYRKTPKMLFKRRFRICSSFSITHTIAWHAEDRDFEFDRKNSYQKHFAINHFFLVRSRFFRPHSLVDFAASLFWFASLMCKNHLFEEPFARMLIP